MKIKRPNIKDDLSNRIKGSSIKDILNDIDRELIVKGRSCGKYIGFPIMFECERFEHDFYIHLFTPEYVWSVPNPSPFYIRMFMKSRLHKYCVLREFWSLYLYLMSKTICKLEVN